MPTTITNVIATLQGTASPERFYVVTGHLDSRVTDVLDFTSDAPGADDDASGVAVVLELARVFATRQFPGTLVFATVAGRGAGPVRLEPHGRADGRGRQRRAGHVQQRHRRRQPGLDGTKPDPFTVRMFLEGIPTSGDRERHRDPADGRRRERRPVAAARPVRPGGSAVRPDRHERPADLAPRPVPAGQRHVSFQGHGYPAARFTEPRENFDHEHQNTQVVNGVQFGDLIEFVDFNYVARVARVNAAALWALATAPATPKDLQIHTTPPGTLSGTNLTTLSWDANPESNLAGYEVVMRETTSPDWTSAIHVGNVTTVTLDISKDNVQFGLRAVDTDGNRSPVAFPQVAD